jgi:para-nitrobenzyl esterase
MGHTAEIARETPGLKTQNSLTVTSPSFGNGADIPFENTQYRGNRFPGLRWSGGPHGTRSYVVIMQGEGLIKDSLTSIHLTLWNIPSMVTVLERGMTTPPAGATYGPNVHGLNQPYAGPHTHTAAKQSYHLQVFALDRRLQLPSDASFEAIEQAMAGHVLANGELIGWAAKDPNAP